MDVIHACQEGCLVIVGLYHKNWPNIYVAEDSVTAILFVLSLKIMANAPELILRFLSQMVMMLD